MSLCGDPVSPWTTLYDTIVGDQLPYCSVYRLVYEVYIIESRGCSEFRAYRKSLSVIAIVILPCFPL